MTSLITKNKINYSKQQGVSLMLSILVLSAITAIAFSLAAIVLVELRSSGDVLRTEPALYATLGASEEALFQYKRFVNDREDGSTVNTLNIATCFPANQNICQLGNVALTFPGTQPLQFDNTPRVETVYAGTVTKIPLYTLNNFNLQYGKIVLQIVPNGTTASLAVNMVKTAIDGTVTDPLFTPSYSITSASSPLQLTSFVGNNQYDLVLDNTANSTQNILVSISSYDTNSTTPKGLPFIGQQVLKITADYLGLTRVYTIKIPIP